MWTISNWQAKRLTFYRLGKFSWKTIWENQHHFLTMPYLGCSQRECQISNDVVASYRDMFESRISAGAREKRPTGASGKPDAETTSSWSYDMEGHAKKCADRNCQLANKTTQQLYRVATPCMDDHQFKEEENESVGEFCTVCSQIVLKCLYLALFGRPDILWSVNKLARAVTKMDKILWQTLGAFDLIHSSYKWIPAILLCETHDNNADLNCFKTLILQETLKTQNQHQRNSVHFRKSHVCANKLDVQETDFSFTRFYRNWDHFSRCRFTHGRYSRSHSLGFGDWSVFIPYRTEQMDPRESHGEPRSCQVKHAWLHPNQAHQRHSNKHWSHSIKYIAFWFTVLCCVSLRTMRQ